VPVYSLGDDCPDIDPTAYVHPDAVLIGAVTVGPAASIWPTAVLRADYGTITVGARTSIQDGTVVHTNAKRPTRIGSDCVIGHNAHLEGCTIEDHCLVASMSTVLGAAVVGPGAVVAAGAVVVPGTIVGPGTRAVGVPARVVDAPLDRAELAAGVQLYVDNAARYARELRLIAMPPDAQLRPTQA
jgi:carbonic anhydrase/acetyltransferase-like protein (isoleucine patch superfamily)